MVGTGGLRLDHNSLQKKTGMQGPVLGLGFSGMVGDQMEKRLEHYVEVSSLGSQEFSDVGAY